MWRNYSQTLLQKINIEDISGSTVGSFMVFVLIFIASWGLSKWIENKLQTTCFWLLQSHFNKQKDMIFEEKYFSYIILTDQISLSGCLYFARY